MSKVYNRSKEYVEDAKKVRCPVCRGFGNTFSRARNDQECICEGRGELWAATSGSGWHRIKGKPIEESFLY